MYVFVKCKVDYWRLWKDRKMFKLYVCNCKWGFENLIYMYCFFKIILMVNINKMRNFLVFNIEEVGCLIIF